MIIPVIVNTNDTILHRIILKCDNYDEFAEAFKKIYTQVYMFGQTHTALRKYWSSHPKSKFMKHIFPIIQVQGKIVFKQVYCTDIYMIESLTYEDGKVYANLINPENKVNIWDIPWRRGDLSKMVSMIHKMIINGKYAN